MRHLSIVLLLMLGLSGLFVLTPGLSDEDHQKARRLKELGEILPLEQIIRAAKAEQPGRVIEVELENKDGRHVYEVELLDTRGDVWELYFDAATGKLIKRGRED
ncbi:MAG: PepSY domain-containing protein [Gammaproteobacteria bacterium]|nr:PepSY domain-containing protein [Gammaproteobacteria bacterium]